MEGNKGVEFIVKIVIIRWKSRKTTAIPVAVLLKRLDIMTNREFVVNATKNAIQIIVKNAVLWLQKKNGVLIGRCLIGINLQNAI